MGRGNRDAFRRVHTQATALSIGAVAQVQLIIILELPFTLVLASIVLGGPLNTREWTAIAAMTVGVALLLYMLEPRGGAVEGRTEPGSTVRIVRGGVS